MKLDLDLVGDDVKGGPGPFADREVSPAQGEAAGEDPGVALGREGGGHQDLPGLALDGQVAGDLVAVIADGLDAARGEAGGRKGRGVEPGLGRHLFIGLRGTGINAGQVNLDHDLGAGRLGRIKVQLAAEGLETAVHADPHLGVAKGDATLVGLELGEFHGLGCGGHQGAQGKQEGKSFHLRISGA